jgi:hypothetical protein
MRFHQEKSPTEFNEENSTKRIPGAAGTKPAPRSFPVKCSNLARGESTKDPACVFGCGRGFSLTDAGGARAIISHAIERGLIIGLRRN